MIQPQLDYKARAEQGIRSSAEHAEQDVPGWGEMALAAVLRFANSSQHPFTMEECRGVVTFYGLPDPPELRAWGAVTQNAIRQGIIIPTGQYARAQSSNGSPKPLYVGCV